MGFILSSDYNKFSPQDTSVINRKSNITSGTEKINEPLLILPEKPYPPELASWERLGLSGKNLYDPMDSLVNFLPSGIDKDFTFTPPKEKTQDIKYPDRKTRQFVSDDKGLKKYTTPEGIVWTRESDPDKDGFADWKSNKGGKWRGKDKLNPDGTYEYQGMDEVKRVIKPDGTEETHYPERASSDFKRLFEKNFSRLDTNRDGRVSEEEINRAIGDGSFSGEDSQMLNALKDHHGRIADIVKDKKGGISLADIREFDIRQKNKAGEYNEALYAKEFGEANFDKLDTSRNGYITKKELQKALQSNQFSEEDKNKIRHLLANIDEIKNISNDEWGSESDIHRNDLKGYEAKDAKLAYDVEGSMSSVRDKVRNAKRTLYGDQDPLKSIKPEAIGQGSIGDCYFLAALASMAKSNPNGIKNMIKDNGDGTFTVTFPGAPKEPVTVNSPTDVELTRYVNVGQDGVWASVLEKAYGKYCNNGLLRRNPLSNLTGRDVDSEGADGGKLTGSGLKILTGKGVDGDILATTRDSTTHDKLTRAIREKRPVTVATFPKSISKKKGLDDRGFVAGHVYSVLDYNPDTKMVTVRNPWGGGEPAEGLNKQNGKFELPLHDFTRAFFHVAYGE